MASFLYYSLDKSIIPDSEFDAMCKRLSDNWDDLDRLRQWQLGSAKEIRASGYHVKVTHATIGGALSWLEDLVDFTYPEGQWSKRYQVEYFPASGFSYKKKRVRL